MGSLPMEQPASDRLLTEQDLAQMGLAKLRTIQDWRRKGRGPHFIKVERCVRYRLSDVLAYLESRPGGGRIIAKPVSLADSVQQKD